MTEIDTEVLDKLLGNAKGIEQFDRWQLLKLELRAIEFWDAQYYADHLNRDSYDISSFKARQARKTQILRELARK